MKTKLFLLQLLFASITGYAQSLINSSIDSGGASVVSGNLQVTYTLGEVVVQEYNTGNLQVSEGFINGNFEIVPCSGGITTFTEMSGWDNGSPDETMTAIIDGIYATQDTGDIEACELIITSNGFLTIHTDTYVRVQNDIINEGSIEILKQGILVQVEDDGLASNLSDIEVLIETPLLKPRDFMILGSPLTDATPIGLDNPIFRIMQHNTSNFSPNTEVQLEYPDGTNFYDQEGDDWSIFAGAHEPARGYFVRPQIDFNDGDKQYNLSYSHSGAQGTFNTGTIVSTIVYNSIGTPEENKNASPNMLANPYPSPISATDFISANDAVDEIYLWEHNTPPGEFPGWNTINFTMADISIYNALGFNPASTGYGNINGDINDPNVDLHLSTSQGFAIKNNGSQSNVLFTNSMRRIDNNNTLRTSSTDKVRIWLAITSEQYDIGSTALIGFESDATPGLDAQYDSKRVGTPVSIYSHLKDGSEQLAIQGREAFNLDQEIGIGFSTQIESDNEEYIISLAGTNDLQIIGENIYLVDHHLGSTTNLLENEYSFLSSQGTFNNRFSIVFKDNTTLSTEGVDLNQTLLYPNPTKDLITITSENTLIKTIEIIDMLGRVILDKKIGNTSQATITLEGFPNGMYIAQIETEDGTLHYKRVIKKN